MEKDFSELDNNYKNTSVNGIEFEFRPGFESPVCLEGFPFRRSDGTPCRLPEDIVKRCETPLATYAFQGPGEAVRFRTDSPYFGIIAEFSEVNIGINRRSSAGFDAYIHTGDDMRFVGNQVLSPDETVLKAVWKDLIPADGDMYDVTIYFPCQSAVGKFYLGLKPGSHIEAPTPHRRPGRLVFYGSSLTHCGASSRPGMIYSSIIGRMLDIEIVNFGFSGRCKGDLPIAELAASLDPDAFIIEFDHNSPDPEFLAERHEKFFKHFRLFAPDAHVLLLSKPDFFVQHITDSFRRNIIVNTWQNAIASGDRHVDFIDGETIFSGPLRYDCTDDNCHQNNIGEVMMAEKITDRLRSRLYLR